MAEKTMGNMPRNHGLDLLRLHLTVLFHGMTLTLLFGLFVPGSVGLWEILRACFPLITYTYWCFTLYVGGISAVAAAELGRAPAER